MNRYICSAVADIGHEREKQEDFVQFKELDKDTILGIVADGTGSHEQYPHPAAIASMRIVDFIGDIYGERKDLFLQAPEFFLKRAFLEANQVLGAFRMGNEEYFSGYAACVTACVCHARKISFAHSGNSRLYLMRSGKLKQLTKDHTVAQHLLDEGKITPETYHVHPDRLKLTSCLGIFASPMIQTMSGKLHSNDLIFLSTDGIHYALRPEAITQIILESGNGDVAVHDLVRAAKEGIKYPDNMSCMIIYETGMDAPQTNK